MGDLCHTIKDGEIERHFFLDVPRRVCMQRSATYINKDNNNQLLNWSVSPTLFSGLVIHGRAVILVDMVPR